MRPWSIGIFRLWSRYWRRLSLVQQFLVMTSLAVGVNMLAIGYWAEKRIFQNTVSTMAETSALYLEAALSPHVQSLGSSRELTPDEQRRIDDMLRNTQLADRVATIKIWGLDGELIYSTDDPVRAKGRGSEKPKPALLLAAAGEVAVDFEGHDTGWTTDGPRRVEIYAPVYRTGTRTPIAVGEFYEDFGFLQQTIAHHRATMWLSVVIFTMVIIGLIYLIVARAGRTIERQRAELVNHLEKASRLARRNDRLRQIAEKARLDATVANEAYLAGIGADLHDGPIQVLGLAMLKSEEQRANSGGTKEPLRQEITPLVQQAVQELRALATGLVLPEIAEITLEDTIRLAVERHESFTGTSVRCAVGPLAQNVSTALKLCAYRVVQESLNNSYRHAAGRGQSVTAFVTGNFVEILIGDCGGGIASTNNAKCPSLGLRGLTNRVKAVRGTLTIRSDPGVGTEVRVRLPLQPHLAT